MPGIFPTSADFTVLDFELWLFVFLRLSIILFLLPVVGSIQVPVKSKIGLAFFLSVLVYTVLPELEVDLPETLAGFAFLGMKELFVGIVMGFASSLMFVGINIAGRMIDYNTGFAMIQSLNPLTETNESVVGQIQFAIFSLLFVVTGGHLDFIRICTESFQIIPLLDVRVDYSKIVQVMLALSSQAFIYGLKMAAPVLVPLLLTTSGLAIVAKIMPQINVWLVGLPLKIIVGLGSVAFVLPLLWEVFKKQVTSVLFHQLALLKIFGGI